MNAVGYIWRAMVAGAAAGLLAALFFLVVIRPTIDQATVVEEALTTELSGTSEREPSIVSRPGQVVGGVAAAVTNGTLLGTVFGTVFAAVRHRVPGSDDFRRVQLLAVLAYGAVVALPAIKYPPNPPGVGNPATVDQRTVWYVTLLVAALAVILVVAALHRWFRNHVTVPTADSLAVAGLVVVWGVTLVVWPSDTTTTPSLFPADLLWRFRLQVLGMQTITWSVLGLVAGWLFTRFTTNPI